MTGWHQIEKQPRDVGGLHRDDTPEERAKMADQLVADTPGPRHLRAESVISRRDQPGNGAKELLDEVATGKVTGEEEF